MEAGPTWVIVPFQGGHAALPDAWNRAGSMLGCGEFDRGHTGLFPAQASGLHLGRAGLGNDLDAPCCQPRKGLQLEQLPETSLIASIMAAKHIMSLS